jgi:hypothetical protein
MASLVPVGKKQLDQFFADQAAIVEALRDTRREAMAERKRETKRAKRAEIGLLRDAAFVGVDGEGGGTDAKGRQNYLLLRAGEQELFRDNAPLTMHECLDFICSLPRHRVYVGFSFGYDVTQILRTLNPARVKEMFMSDEDRKDKGIKRQRYVFAGRFKVDFLPGHYFRVCRLREKQISADGETYKIWQIEPDSSRTIYEAWGFFQGSFLKALDDFKIATPDELELIERNKNARGSFVRVTPEIQNYCAMECDLLARLMERFRVLVRGGQVLDDKGERIGGLALPRTWNGAGKLAAALHEANNTMQRKDYETLLSADLRDYAKMAYYGGRFEITHVGKIDGPIWEYDIRSAYPSAMLDLPCLKCGTWKKASQSDLASLETGALYVADCRYKHPKGQFLCGLPVRSNGHLSWRRQGEGVYWSVEIEAARRLGAKVTCLAGWIYEKRCDCQPFQWVKPLYDSRMSLGDTEQGKPVKLAINALYGQLAARVGSGRWQNHIWAGLITAITRAKLIDAALSAKGGVTSVLMLATDAIYSTSPLDVPVGENLGQWEENQHPHIFICQPGLYWGPPKPKTRGIPRTILEPHTARLERRWERFMGRYRAAVRPALCWPPSVPVRLSNFIGLRLAHARGNPDLAGRWEADWRLIDFRWVLKRHAAGAIVLPNQLGLRLAPWPGGAGLRSERFDAAGERRAAAREAIMEQMRAELFDRLDGLELKPPGF